MDYVNLQRAALNELTHEFRQLVLRQQQDWLGGGINHAQAQGGPVRTELPDAGCAVLFKPDSLAWEFTVTIGGRDPMTFSLQHDAPWRCWDTNVRGDLAVLLASEGTGAAMQADEFDELAGQVKTHLGTYIRNFRIQLPPAGETNFNDYR